MKKYLKIPEYYDFMDGLRGIAVLWVIAHHFFAAFNVRDVFIQAIILFKMHHLEWAAALGANLFDVYVRLAFFGNYGVDMFFVISGFLITGLLMDFKERETNILHFYIRRFFKIIPHYYFVIVISLLGLVLFTKMPTLEACKEAVILFLFQQNYFQVDGILGHTWSLVIEEQFYLFWGFLLWGLSLAKLQASQRFYGAVLVCSILLLLINLHRVYFYSHGHTFFDAARGPVHFIQMFWLRADGLMAGCLVRLFLPLIVIRKWQAWGIYSLGLLLYLILLAAPVEPVQYGVPARWWDLTLAWLAPACLIIAGINRCAFISYLKPLRIIGRSSYGIYLVHFPLLRVFGSTAAPEEGSLMSGICFILASIFMGMATTYCVEKPFLKLSLPYRISRQKR